MERQTKHRILGVLVVIGLVVILLPFFQGGSDIPPEAALVKAPPFPDQAQQTSANGTTSTTATVSVVSPPTSAQPSSNEQPDDTINLNQQPTSVAPAPQVMPAETAPSPAETAKPADAAPDTVTTEDSATSGGSTATTPVPAPEIKTSTPEMTTTPNTNTSTEPAMGAPDEEPTVIHDDSKSAQQETVTPVQSSKNTHSAKHTKKQLAVKKAHAKAAKKVAVLKPKLKSAMRTAAIKKHAAKHKEVKSVVAAAFNKKTPLDQDGLINLRDASWVIQMGSFNDKKKALALVNKLREKGYRTFIQQVSGSPEENTRVFVGPENKQTAARSLATKIEREANIHGIVISYKPLAM